MLNDALLTILEFVNNWTVYGMSLSDLIDTVSSFLPYFQDFLTYISDISYFVPWAHIKIIISLAISSVVIRSFIAIWKLLPLT